MSPGEGGCKWTKTSPKGATQRNTQEDSRLVQREGALRNRLNVQRDKGLKAVNIVIPTECVVSLEEKLTGDVSGLKNDVKSQASHQ